MIRAFLAGLGYAVAAIFVLLVLCGVVSVPGMAAGLHPRCNIDWPCAGTGSAKRVENMQKLYSAREIKQVRRADRFRNVEFGSPMYPPETQRSWLNGISMPARFVGGRLKCAVNVGVALAERGIRGTGSALAKSYLHWGRPSGPQPGAVAVFSRGRRGGHVAIVQDVRPDGTVIYLNPSSRRQAWQVGPYHKRPIAFRVAS